MQGLLLLSLSRLACEPSLGTVFWLPLQIEPVIPKGIFGFLRYAKFYLPVIIVLLLNIQIVYRPD